ncbi:hypothetical protein QFZ31_003490 [Neobacillus niacini]|nr:hypothetical protein [Neobacillus niacini]MDQ0973612.1 hypothetical protein [Neobacillus niacini]
MNSEEVFYGGKIYMVIYKYSSGYWEIREKENKFNIQLVHESEVQNVS